MFEDEIRCEARVTFRGKELHLNRLIIQADIEDMLPPRYPIMDPFELSIRVEQTERRRRFVDCVAAEFAQALTEALYKAARQ